jgi:elongation factor G
MVSMNVPEPVMSLAVMPKARDGSGNLSKALSRYASQHLIQHVMPGRP